MKKYKTEISVTSAEIGDDFYRFKGELKFPIKILYDNKKKRGNFKIEPNDFLFDFVVENDEIAYEGVLPIKRVILEKALVAVLNAVYE